MSWPRTFLGLALLLNLLASVAVIRNRGFSQRQRLLQLLVVWLLPVLGSVACLVFASTQFREISPASSDFDPLYNPADGGYPDSHGFGEGHGGAHGDGH